LALSAGSAKATRASTKGSLEVMCTYAATVQGVLILVVQGAV
jgi:hypothetical protein